MSAPVRTPGAVLCAFGAYELDLHSQELRRSGEVVHLEPQVFALLVLLVENRDRIVSKDEILDKIWDGRIVSEAALSSRINAARRAVGDTGQAQALIRTHHKRGFRFVGEVVEQPLGDEARSAPLASTPGDAQQGSPSGRRASVAVMPFANVNDDPEYDYFAYGLTEDVIRLLGRHRWLTVLTRHTTAELNAQNAPLAAVGATLGVRYVVRGSVRRLGSRVRIAVELADAQEGGLLWSEVYDLDLADIFDVQEGMARQIAALIEPELASRERELAARRPPSNLDAWECYQRGLYHLWGFTTPGFAEAERMFRRAVELDPELARAHGGLSYVHLQKAFYDDIRERPANLRTALAEGEAAVRLDERDSFTHCVLGRALCLHRNYEAAVAQLKTTIELNPSFAQGYFALAFALVWQRQEEEAIALVEQATELSPRDPHLWTFHLTRAYAHFSLGELDSAEVFARKATEHPNATHVAYGVLVAVLALQGKSEEAREIRAGLLARKPGYSQKTAREDLFFCANEDFVSRYIEGLRQAGVPA